MNTPAQEKLASERKGRTGFMIHTASVFCILAAFLYVVDFVPVPVSIVAVDAQTIAASAPSILDVPVELPTVVEEVIPMRVVIDSIGLDANITAPASDSIDVLDRALLTGAVQYPGSANLSEVGNMLLFGHSSYLPIVKNKAYQAFNDLGKVTPGDIVTVYSETHVHQYKVKQVRLVRAENAQVAFDTDVPMLTLATCNTFGAKQDRWVVTAEWIQKEQL